jgi:hypothetical protein
MTLAFVFRFTGLGASAFAALLAVQACAGLVGADFDVGIGHPRESGVCRASEHVGNHLPRKSLVQPRIPALEARARTTK